MVQSDAETIYAYCNWQDWRLSAHNHSKYSTACSFSLIVSKLLQKLIIHMLK